MSLLLIAGGVGRLCGQTPSQALARSPEIVTVVAGPEYAAGWPRTWLFGRHNRDLWTAPIAVEVLDLSRFAGGLAPLTRGGGGETTSLHLRAADGREYVFRSVHKHPTRALPPELRETFVGYTWQDQSSSEYPGGALVVSPLLAAAGVLQVEGRLYVMPDDPRLGEFREEFRGMLGELELRPTVASDEDVGFAGAERIVGSQKLWQYLGQDSRNRVDSRAFLAARLLDLLVGDWDRGAYQWRWARFDEGRMHVWRPIPRDRDRAFSSFDGLLPWVAHYFFPEVVGFGEHYQDLVGLTWLGRELDRRLLVDLEKPVWDSVAGALQASLTDATIDLAVHRLPPEYYRRDGARLTRALKRRRDELSAAADRYFAILADAVDLQTTDEGDAAVVESHADGTVTVRLSPRDSTTLAGAPYYARTFRGRETREVRLYLRGGGDRVVVRGTWRSAIRVRVISASGQSELVDSSRGSGGPSFYVDHTPARVIAGPRTTVDRHRASQLPVDDPAQYRLRDWGHRWTPRLRASYIPDLGVMAGLGATITWYAFRQDPYKTQLSLGTEYAFGAQGVRGDVSAEFRGLGLGLEGALRVYGSEIEVVRFYGFGNETAAIGPDSFYKVRQEQYLVAASLRAGPSQAARFFFGPILKYSTTTLGGGGLIDAQRPYGVPHFLQYGWAADVRIDHRNEPRNATRGTLLSIGATWYPALGDVRTAFEEAHGEAAAFLTAHVGLEPTLALRVAGKKVWGSYPFHEAAYVGGTSTVRGFPEHRFAGDAAVSGNVELRLRLAPVVLLLPADFGVFGLVDVGRVYLTGAISDRWHAAVGGGVWISFLSRANTLSVAAARSVEATRVYARAGFAF